MSTPSCIRKNDLPNNTYQENIKAIRKRNLNRIIIAYLNIISIKNRSELLVSQIVREVGILVISERTLDDSFPFGSFKFPTFFIPITRDHEKIVGGLLVVRKEIPTKHSLKEIATVECILNFCKKDWL